MKPVTAKWRQKNGELIRICDMTDSHLTNTIKLVARHYRALCFRASLEAISYAYASTTPDGASLCAESEAEHLMDEAESMEYIEDRIPIFRKLINEAKRRKLDITYYATNP